MRLLVTGSSGALGQALVPLARAAGHDVLAPRHQVTAELDMHLVLDNYSAHKTPTIRR